MAKIVKEFSFEAAHQLVGHDGKCANLHGHSYRLLVALAGEPSQVPDAKEGFIMDFGDVKRIVKESFLDQWDHSFLARGDEPCLAALGDSKVTYLGFRTTAEHMSQYILWLLHEKGLPVDFVRLYETATGYAQADMADMPADGPVFLHREDAQADLQAILPVSELFGPTIQGEGQLIGAKTMFLRLHGCDDHCSWCDSKFTWENGGEAPNPMRIADIIARLEEAAEQTGCRHVTLTGGNPCIHDGAEMRTLLAQLKQRGYRFSLETQGTCVPSWLPYMSQITVSPKPPSSGNETTQAHLDVFLAAARQGTAALSIKIVVFGADDFAYLNKLYAIYGAEADLCWFVQPGNPSLSGAPKLSDAVERYKALCEQVVREPALTNIRILPQLHMWLWGNERER